MELGNLLYCKMCNCPLQAENMQIKCIPPCTLVCILMDRFILDLIKLF